MKFCCETFHNIKSLHYNIPTHHAKSFFAFLNICTDLGIYIASKVPLSNILKSESNCCLALPNVECLKKMLFSFFFIRLMNRLGKLLQTVRFVFSLY